jgi:hypothetical protein
MAGLEQSLMQEMIGHYGWIALTFALAFFFKQSIMNMILGMQVFIGNDFNNDDIIYISGREARIVRVGITKTVFYMKDRGTKMIVPNDKLKDLTLEKRLQQGIKPDDNKSRRKSDGYLPKSTDKIPKSKKQGLHAVKKEVSVKH